MHLGTATMPADGQTIDSTFRRTLIGTWRNSTDDSAAELPGERNARIPLSAMSNGLKLSEIGQIAVTVSDVGTALAFYRDVLGLAFLFSAGPNLAFLMAGSVRVMLTTPQGAGSVGSNSTLYFKVTDIEATHAAIVARGATGERAPQLTAKMPDHALWIGFVRDPDGNLVGLMEEKR